MQKADMAKADRLREMSGVNTRKCMKCGKCSATCPAYEEMDIRPHQFVSYVENGDIEPLLNLSLIHISVPHRQGRYRSDSRRIRNR